jgi:hypothetical protein
MVEKYRMGKSGVWSWLGSVSQRAIDHVPQIAQPSFEPIQRNPVGESSKRPISFVPIDQVVSSTVDDSIVKGRFTGIESN